MISTFYCCSACCCCCLFFFFKQKTAYEMRISDWSSDVCSSDLRPGLRTSDPAHFGAGRLEGAAPQTRPGQARRQQHQHEAGNPEAGHSVEIAPEHAPSALETRPHHPCR